MAGKMKRPLPKTTGSEVKGQAPGEKNVDERPWWTRPDDELLKDRLDKVRSWYGSVKTDVDEEDRDRLIEEAVRRDPRIQNLLDMVIVKEQGIGVKGKYLVIPVYRSETGERIAGALGLKTERKIRLDRYGWSVWRLIDGKRDVRKIGKLLSDHFGDEVEPLFPRLAKFLAYLQNLKLIRISAGKKS
ncbi:MAG: PqqD family protein [Candidatus Thermoplasmatota archaeon]|nr:PqqD family protein [Candidatus Thermoplasmatota archaeon]